MPKMTPAIQAAWSEVIARSWSDEEYKRRLLDNPNQVLEDAGIPVPGGTDFFVHENKPGQQHLVLPEPPQGNVDVEQLSTGDYDPGF